MNHAMLEFEDENDAEGNTITSYKTNPNPDPDF